MTNHPTIDRFSDLVARMPAGPDRETCVLALGMLTSLHNLERLSLGYMAATLLAPMAHGYISKTQASGAVDVARRLMDAVDGQPAPSSEPVVIAGRTTDCAFYIFQWLRDRNDGELDEAIRSMPLSSYELAVEELELILEHGGRPPNWRAP
jgi:hypothetical protein